MGADGTQRASLMYRSISLLLPSLINRHGMPISSIESPDPILLLLTWNEG
jgi:hypothetical protein